MSLRDQLTNIARDFGALTPENVVAAARPTTSPLHERFEWDDTVAAEKYRVSQAAKLIRSVRLTYDTDGKGQEQTVRAFLAVPGTHPDSAHRAAYQPSDKVLADPLTTALLLRELERELTALRTKYGHLEGFAAILQAAAAA